MSMKFTPKMVWHYFSAFCIGLVTCYAINEFFELLLPLTLLNCIVFVSTVIIAKISSSRKKKKEEEVVFKVNKKPEANMIIPKKDRNGRFKRMKHIQNRINKLPIDEGFKVHSLEDYNDLSF